MSIPQPVVPAPATRYPGVGPRAVATLIDGILGFVVIGIPLLAVFGSKSTTHTASGTSTTYRTSDPKLLALWFVLAVAYYVVFETTVGATPGKLVLGLRVRDAAGAKCSPRAAVIRNVLRVVDAFPYFVPYLVGAVAIWTDESLSEEGTASRRRRVGDRVARTIVTYR